MPRVLSIARLKPSDGMTTIEEWDATLTEAFAREGGAFITVRDAAAPPGSQATNDGPTICLAFTPFNLTALIAIVRLIYRQRIEIVVWNFTRLIGNPYVWLLTILCPTVRQWATWHISQKLPLPKRPGRLSLAARRLLMSRYERIVCVSDYVADFLHQRGCDNIVTNYLFVNTDRFRPDADVRARVRAELDLGSSFTALFAGHVIPEKGIDVAIDAISRLPSDVVLLVVGEGPELPHLQAMAAARGLGTRVRFLGRRNNVTPLMQAADVLVCPSMWAEAAGLVNMEAQACGVPVVASRIGGIPEIVEDGKTGLLHQSGNAAELSTALETLRKDPELRSRFGRAARERALAYFSRQARIAKTLDLYREPETKP